MKICDRCGRVTAKHKITMKFDQKVRELCDDCRDSFKKHLPKLFTAATTRTILVDVAAKSSEDRSVRIDLHERGPLRMIKMSSGAEAEGLEPREHDPEVGTTELFNRKRKPVYQDIHGIHYYFRTPDEIYYVDKIYRGLISFYKKDGPIRPERTESCWDKAAGVPRTSDQYLGMYRGDKAYRTKEGAAYEVVGNICFRIRKSSEKHIQQGSPTQAP